MALVYRHTNNDDNKVFYIGVSTNKRRPYSKLNRNKSWNNTIKKNGFTVDILTDNIDLETAYELEIAIIQWYGRKDLGTGHLANLCDGGAGSLNHIVSDAKKEQTAHIHRGKKISEETRVKMKIAAKNRPSNKGFKRTLLDKISRSKPVIQLSLKGEYVASYYSAIEAFRQTKIKHIDEVCSKKRQTAGGYKWIFKN